MSERYIGRDSDIYHWARNKLLDAYKRYKHETITKMESIVKDLAKQDKHLHLLNPAIGMPPSEIAKTVADLLSVENFFFV